METIAPRNKMPLPCQSGNKFVSFWYQILNATGCFHWNLRKENLITILIFVKDLQGLKWILQSTSNDLDSMSSLREQQPNPETNAT